VSVFNVRGRYAQDGIVTVHSDHFRADPAFRAAYARGLLASSGVDRGFEWRVHIALWVARTALEKLRWSSTGRRFYLIDTFAGPVLEQIRRGSSARQTHYREEGA
jgi:hypothetical protein